MNERRRFIKLIPALAALPAAAPAFADSKEADDEATNPILGAWRSIHTLPFPPGSFREFLSFAEAGVFHETNSFLYTSSNLNFSVFGLPSAINASDGVGNWAKSRHGMVTVVFRKLLFDGSGANLGDLLVTGTAGVRGGKLEANWHIQVVDASTDAVLTDFGPATI